MKKFIMGYVFGVVMCLVSLYIVGICMDKYGSYEVEMKVYKVEKDEGGGERFIEIDND